MTTAPHHAGQARRSDVRRPRVVVVGGGFAGLTAVRMLGERDVDVLLLDRNAYATFQPLLYQVATGGLNPGDVTFALRAFTGRFSNVRFRRVTVTGVDADGRHVRTDTGDEIAYDYLILSSGVTANYFGVPGAQEHAKTIYTRGAALEVRDSLFSNLESVSQDLPSAVEPVFVVVGGGATGVEMAGMLAEMRTSTLPATYPEIDLDRVRVVLVEMTDDVLGPFDPDIREYAAQELRERGVDLRLATAVKEVQSDCVVLSDGERVPSAATIWATGVKADDRVSQWGLPQGRGGRVEVEPDMRVVGHPEIFAVGDLGARTDDPLPQLAQPAIQGGRHAATQIIRLLAGMPTYPMRYRDKGTMATIGRSDAVVQFPGGLKLRGLIAWLAWVGLHIVQLTGQRNRLATLMNLSVRYLAGRGRHNVIVGDPP
ncbi:MAG TPA: NAD(P)/FAD-dependent oxidoreductase [Euzebyales bacterium]|nr:NAD(P)/FAD-dependent oxidoreductase [Euzebyales bacterium]